MSNQLTLAEFTNALATRLQHQKSSLPPMPGNKIVPDRNKEFTFPDSRVMPSFRGILIDYRFEKKIYKDRWKPGVISMPICYAIGSDYNALIPHDDVEKPFASACNGCPKNQWSGQGRGATPPECSDGVRLAVLSSDAADRPKLYKLSLSRTAISPFTKVISGLKEPTATQMWEFSMDQEMEYPSVRLRPVGPIDTEQAQFVMNFLDQAAEMLEQSYLYE